MQTNFNPNSSMDRTLSYACFSVEDDFGNHTDLSVTTNHFDFKTGLLEVKEEDPFITGKRKINRKTSVRERSP